MDITGLELSPNHNHIIDPEPKDTVTFAQYMTVHRGHNTSYKVVSLTAPVAVVGMTGLVTSRAHQIPDIL